MKNFEEIAEKCLKGELSGTFICDLNGEIIKVSSEKLSRYGNLYKLKYSGSYTYDDYNSNGFSTPTGINRVINFIPDIKNDKRNVQISLYQAREWYRGSDNTLKTLALSAFDKKELDPYPRSWGEYLKNHPINLVHAVAPGNLGNKLTVYGALLTLREEWIHIWSQEHNLEKDWEPNWDDSRETKHTIISKPKEGEGIVVSNCITWSRPLSFPTIDLAIDFMNTFRSLLEQVKRLY